MKNSLIWFSVEKTIDCKGKYIANSVICDLNQSTKGYLITFKELQRTNSLITRFVDEILSQKNNYNSQKLRFLHDKSS